MSEKEQGACEFRTMIGGQALIEGILMRGPTKQAIVIRKSDGTLVDKVEEPHFVREKHKWLGWPIIRGAVAFIESMVYGVKALTYSANMLPEDEQEKCAEEMVQRVLGPASAEKFL